MLFILLENELIPLEFINLLFCNNGFYASQQRSQQTYLP